MNEDNTVFACAKNADKDKINRLIVSQLPGEEMEYISLISKDDPEYDEMDRRKMIFKENIRVMLAANIRERATMDLYANGQTGILKKIYEDRAVLVEFDNGKQLRIEPQIWQVDLIPKRYL